jgi:hypothetical protein
VGHLRAAAIGLILLAGCSAPPIAEPNATPSAAAATVFGPATDAIGCAASPGPTAVVAPDGASTLATVAPSRLPPFHVAILGDSLATGDFGPPAIEDRWWSRAGVLVQAARPDRDVVVSNFGLAGSGIEYVEKTITTLNARDYQVAIVMEGRNDYQSNADWSPRLVKVMQSLERQGLVVILVTIPPILSKGELLSFSRNPCIRSIAGTTRPLLDVETRWYGAGPAVAAAWYSDSVHASLAGQVVEAELAGALLLTLVR